MKSSPLICLLALLASASTPGGLLAADSATPAAGQRVALLKAGDFAPAYQPGKWVQGEAVTAFDREHVYLLEFWATWCGPCKAAIPHVNALHEKFKDKGLVVIGQNVWEDQPDKVEPFVKNMAGKLNYRIALDENGGKGVGQVADAWLKAAGKNAIPATFLVGKDGRIAWIGHPMALTEEIVGALLDGEFTAKPAKPETAGSAPAGSAAPEAAAAFYQALQAKDWAKAEASLAEVEKQLPDGQKSRATIMRVSLLMARGSKDEAAALAESACAAAPNDLMLANSLASLLTREPDAGPIALAAAEKIANGANEALNGKNASSLIVLARIAFMRGDQAKAVELQSKVVELSKPAARPRMNEFLESYKAGKLPDPAARSAARAPEGKDAGTARAVSVKAGDPAPAYQPGKWLQGEAVTAFDRNHIYLIEFWATWCGPCKAAIPHVNALHEKFKDKGLVVIGQNVWENDVSKVEPFVKSMAGKLNYRVAVDEGVAQGKGRVADAWLKAAGIGAIPATFLVDKTGTVAWIGHPMKLTEKDIEEMLAGTFRIKKAAPADRADTHRAPGLTDGEKQALAAIRNKDWTAAETAIETIRKETSDNPEKINPMRLELMLAKGDHEAAAALAEKICADAGNNLPLKDMIASRLARVENPPPALLDAAERIASFCNEALNGKNIGSLNTLARIAFLRGNQARAVELQTQAFDLSKPAAQPRMKLFLDAYKAGKLPDTQAGKTAERR